MTIKNLRDYFRSKTEESAENRRKKKKQTTDALDEFTARRLDSMIEQQNAGIDLGKTLADLSTRKEKKNDDT